MIFKSHLSELIESARQQDLWLHCNYQDLWFSPDELEEQNIKGKFLWSVENWTLQDPHVKLERLMENIQDAKKTYNDFRARMGDD